MITLTSLDRTIFEYIRLGTVAAGYLPDWKLLTGTQTQREAAYLAAKEAQKLTGKEVIEVFGHGSAEAKLETRLHRIGVNRRAMSPGAIGLKNTVVYQFKGSDYGKEVYADDTVDVLYDIRCITDKVSYERNMYEILSGIFKVNTQMPSLDLITGALTNIEIQVSYETYLDLSASRLIETSFTVRVQHVALGNPVEVDASIPILNTVIFKTYVVPLALPMEEASTAALVETTVD